MPTFLDEEGDPQRVAFGSHVMLKGRPCKVVHLDITSKRKKCIIAGVDVLTSARYEDTVGENAVLVTFELLRKEYEVDSVEEAEDGGVTVAGIVGDSVEEFQIGADTEPGAALLEAFQHNEDNGGDTFFVITVLQAPVGKGKKLSMEEAVVEFREGSEDEELNNDGKHDVKDVIVESKAKQQNSKGKGKDKATSTTTATTTTTQPVAINGDNGDLPIVSIIGQECWGYCLSFLKGDLPRWATLARVCRDWYCNRKEEVWYNSYSLVLPELNDNAAKALSKLCHGGGDGGPGRVGSVGGIQHLNLDGCRNLGDKGARALSALTGLTTLSMRECGKVTDKGFTVLLPPLTNLEVLNLSGNSVTDDSLQHLPGSLKCLNLSECKSVSDVTLRGIASSLLHLRELNISSCNNVTNEGVKLVSSLTMVETLILSFCSSLTDEACESIAVMKTLQTLNMAWCSGLSDRATAKLGMLPNLTALNLSVCPGITNSGVEALTKAAGSLKQLDFIGCSSMDDNVLPLVATFTNLTSLNMSGTNVTPSAAAALLQTMPNLESFIVVSV